MLWITEEQCRTTRELAKNLWNERNKTILHESVSFAFHIHTLQYIIIQQRLFDTVFDLSRNWKYLRWKAQHFKIFSFCFTDKVSSSFIPDRGLDGRKINSVNIIFIRPLIYIMYLLLFSFPSDEEENVSIF